jgi:hemoglobin
MSIYDELGGADGVSAAVDEFYRRVLDDGALAPYFEGVDLSRLRSHQRAFIAAALDGPERYEGRDMATAHAGLGVTDAAFERVVGHLTATLDQLGATPDAIAEVGTRLAPLQTEIVSSADPTQPAA